MVEVIVATIMRPTGDTGVQTHFCTFMHWLSGKGRPPSVITPYSAPLWMVYPMFAIRRVIDRFSGPASVWWYRYWHEYFVELALQKKLGTTKDCVIYAQCPSTAAAALRARRGDCQKVVLVVHFNISQADEWIGKGMLAANSPYANAIRTFEADTLSKVDGLVFVSKYMQAELLKRIPAIDKVPSTVIPNFVPDPGNPAFPRTHSADLLTVGTLEPRKNQAYALQIIAAAAKQGVRLTLNIAGAGPDADALKLLAKELSINDRVHFLGLVPNAAELFATHQACLHVARMESFGIVLIEAMARALPVFAPPVGGIPEVFSDPREGRFIPLDAPDEAASILIAWFQGDGTKLLEAGANGRARFLDQYQSSVAAANLDAFLVQVTSA